MSQILKGFLEKRGYISKRNIYIFWKMRILTNGSMASRSLILLLLRFRCDNKGQSCRVWSPLLIRLSLNSNFLSLANLGNPLRVVKPTLIRLRDSKLTYSSDRPSICVALALSKLSSLICKKRTRLHKYFF